MALTLIIGILGGLGLFLYGMQLMGAGLQKAAGKRLERIIEVLTVNKFVGMLVGLVVTGIIQSSSATTVMVVGFVNAGVMKLTQAVGIIMGANIGTTVTGQLVSFKLEEYAPVAVGIGVIMLMLSKKDKNKNLAQILVGFGILFIGMEFLKDALSPLKEIPAFTHAMINLGENPILGVLVGFGLTFMVQSSSASIGMLIALASQGVLPLAAAVPILYGDNIGTCTTALLSSIGTNKNARRAAIIHLSFNVIGTLIFMLFLTKPIMYFVQLWDPTDIGRQIANTHTMFNILNVVIQLPFSFVLVKIAMLVIPERGEEKLKLTKYLDYRILETPTIAMTTAIKETIHMGSVVRESVENAMHALIHNSDDHADKVLALEVNIDLIDKEITEYLIALSNKQIGDDDRKIVDGLFNCINDIERIGDKAENIALISKDLRDKKIIFTADAKEELIDLYEKAMNSFVVAIQAMESNSKDKAYEVVELEAKIDEIEKRCRKGHIQRLNRQECTPESGIIFLDIVNDLERISDLAAKLARVVIDTPSFVA